MPTLTILNFQNHVESDGNPILPVPRGPRCSSSATQAPMAPEAPGYLRCCLDPKTDALGLLCYFASAKWWVCLRKVDWILVIFWVLFKSEELVFCLCFFFSFFKMCLAVPGLNCTCGIFLAIWAPCIGSMES